MFKGILVQSDYRDDLKMFSLFENCVGIFVIHCLTHLIMNKCLYSILYFESLLIFTLYFLIRLRSMFNPNLETFCSVLFRSCFCLTENTCFQFYIYTFFIQFYFQPLFIFDLLIVEKQCFLYLIEGPNNPKSKK